MFWCVLYIVLKHLPTQTVSKSKLVLDTAGRGLLIYCDLGVLWLIYKKAMMEVSTPGRIIDHSATCPYVPLYLCSHHKLISAHSRSNTSDLWQ